MSDEEDYSQYDVVIGNKEYRMVAGRLQEFLDDCKKNKLQVYRFPEWLILNDNPVCRYHICVLTENLTFLAYTAGTAGAYGRTAIDKSNPYENAETSAMGRALASLGYGLISGIASAEEVAGAKERQPKSTSKQASEPQIRLIHRLETELSLLPEEIDALKAKYKVDHHKELTVPQASELIDNLQRQIAELAGSEK